ncbi:MAG TPA: amino acid permease [Vicinamibacterales bacterium]|jgi:APA family basic amino acid/polyamine antiporter|nr:amino acid permease [Vicinamibacterales bacterium]
MPSSSPRRLTTWAATAMIVTQVIGVGIFLTPASMMRSVGGLAPALLVWLIVGLLSVAGALCYAELTTRFPQAGGGYVFLREAFGSRAAFVFGWISLLVTDPGITAALAIGFAQYFLAAIDAPSSFLTATAIATVCVFGVVTLAGRSVSSVILRWTAAAKLAIVGLLVVLGVLRAGSAAGSIAAAPDAVPMSMGALAGAVIAAFFAFGGWWELGRMSEEVEAPRRTMPRALIGGVAIVTGVYALITIAYTLGTSGRMAGDSDVAFVADVGRALFGPTAGRTLAAVVVVAVSGSLAATLLASPRMYLAMSRDKLFPGGWLRFDLRRGTAPGATLIQGGLACVLIALGTFEQILGYFIPITIFFLGLSAASLFRLPRPAADDPAFRTPFHPLPLVLFLCLIAVVLILFAVGRPRETLIGAAIAILGVPASFIAERTLGQRASS